MNRFYVKHKVLYAANNHPTAGVNIHWRDGIPKLTLDKNFTGRHKRRADNRYFADHPLLTGYDFISARPESDAHKKYRDNPNRDSHC